MLHFPSSSMCSWWFKWGSSTHSRVTLRIGCNRSHLPPQRMYFLLAQSHHLKMAEDRWPSIQPSVWPSRCGPSQRLITIAGACQPFSESMMSANSRADVISGCIQTSAIDVLAVPLSLPSLGASPEMIPPQPFTHVSHPKIEAGSLTQVATTIESIGLYT